MSYAKAVEKYEKVDAVSIRTDYRCAAHGCPNMGGIGGGTQQYGKNRAGVCFFHFSSEPGIWPEVTRQILADRNMRDPIYVESAIVADKRKEGPRAWAHVLKAREAANERLTGAQKAMWRAAIGEAA